MKTRIFGCIVFGLFWGGHAIAAVPNIFSAGEPARAADVNADFSNLDSRVSTNTSKLNSIPVTNVYDYTKYVTASNITSKTYDLTGSFCTNVSTETRTYSRTTSGTNTDVVMTLKRQDVTGVCLWRDIHYLETPTQHQLLGAVDYDNSGNLTATVTLASPLVVATNAMTQGVTFGDATTVSATPVGASAMDEGIFMQTTVALDIENVTVKAGSFSACLKTSIVRSSLNFGAYQRISWFCPGMGEVKRMVVVDGSTTAAGSRIWELSSYN